MKKTLKTFALMLLTAIAFSSCVDVPAPFNLPDKSSNSGGGGSGTIEGTPVTCAQAAELAKALADGATSSEIYTITGYITEVFGNVSRNQQSFWMADTKGGGKVFEAFWANLPEGMTEFKVGTKVKITGKLLKFVNTSGSVVPEMKNANVQILEDDMPIEEGTSVSCVMAAQLTAQLPDGGTSAETYTVTGYITKIVGAVSKNQQSFWMADSKDGGEIFEAFYANLPEGVSEFVVGMKVKITGKLYNYKNNTGGGAPEIKNATVVILEQGGGGQGGGGNQGDIQHITIAEFLQKADPNTTYELTGTVKNISNTTYGNFDLVEGDASIYIYGLLDQDGASQKFSSLGIAEGDIVTLTGKYFLFNNKPEIKDAKFVSVTKGGGGGQGGGGEQGDIQHITIAEFLQKADPNTTYELTGTVKNISNTTYGNFDLVEGDASIYIYGLLDQDGASQKFSSLGIAEGDIVTLTGKYFLFNNKPEIKDAKFVSVTKGQGGNGDDTPPTPGPGGEEVNELVNGNFEEWVSASEPLGWKSASSASSATVEQFQDSHDQGTFSCLIKANPDTNMRLATQEITLAAGTYVFSFYAKAASASSAQTRIGYVPIKADGSVDSYKYNSAFFDINNNEWTYIENEFTLTAETKVCLLVMNPKSNKDKQYEAQDILVDDAALVKK